MSEKLLTVKQVAAQLNTTTRTVQKWLQTGQLKGMKLVREWRIKQSDLDDWLERRETEYGLQHQ